MSFFHRLSYWMGVTPWEHLIDSKAGTQAYAMLERAEAGREKPYGRALDLGCGRGIWTVELAKRGWEVTGIDVVGKAVRAAERRAASAGVKVRLLEGSATDLRAAGIGGHFDLILDFGLIHGLSPEQVQAAGREVTSVAAGGATLIMYAMSPGKRGPLPRGIERKEIEGAFPDWEVIDDEPFDTTGLPKPMVKAEPRWYRLRHAVGGSA